MNPRAIGRRFYALFKQPFFILFTLWGNGCIFLGASVFYHLESGVNPHIQTFIDSLAWAVGTVTTIGYGGITPVTFAGKILDIFMMMGGSLFLWSYMALFVSALVSPELSTVEHEIKDLEQGLTQLKQDISLDEKTTLKLTTLVKELNELMQNLQSRQKK